MLKSMMYSQKKASSLIRNNNSSDRNIQSLQQQFVRGVIRCYDIDVITDPAAAFLWFKDRYPGAAIVEENKSLLKEKYIEAKALGVTLQTCKKKIEHLKKMVEQIGREREMENLNKCPVNNSFGQEESEAISQIRECQNSIESEMVTYKEGFNKLRHLKATI